MFGIDLRDPDQPIGTLSGGERQAVAIARAVYFGAEVVILDEPTSALGVKQSGKVLKFVRDARDRGIGVVLITHNPHHAYMVGDEFVLLKRGQDDQPVAQGRGGARRAGRGHGRRRRAGGPGPRAGCLGRSPEPGGLLLHVRHQPTRLIGCGRPVSDRV